LEPKKGRAAPVQEGVEQVRNRSKLRAGDILLFP
jgi:hypothetical protein